MRRRGIEILITEGRHRGLGTGRGEEGEEKSRICGLGPLRKKGKRVKKGGGTRGE